MLIPAKICDTLAMSGLPLSVSKNSTASVDDPIWPIKNFTPAHQKVTQ